MRKVMAMGETTLDILFKDMQPVAAVPGGSSFNSIISLGRTGLPCAFVGYTGDDVPGQQTVDFLKENHIDTRYFEKRRNEKSAISLAYLNDNGDASYVFYKPTPQVGSAWQTPLFETDDALLFGSYFACCPGMRPMVESVLHEAVAHDAIIYYDINFRRSHLHELDTLLPAIKWNMRHSTIVRGSADDFDVMFGSLDAEQIYNEHIRAFCPVFICTGGAGTIVICTPAGTFHFQAPPIDDVVSTVGAGDSFNAGLIYAFQLAGIHREQFAHLTEQDWHTLIDTACAFAGDACRSTNNYISHTFAKKLNQ